MRRTSMFLMVYAALLFSTVVVLSLLSVEIIEVYVALFAIEFFVASELTSPFSPAESSKKTVIEILLLAILTGIMIEKIVGILR
jgi:hypothetical protein